MIFTKEYWLNCIDRTKRYAKTFIKWLICSAIIGITCGAVGTAFHYSVEYVTQFRSGHRWIIFLLPAAGLLIVFLYRAGGIKHDKGTNLVIGSIRNPEYNVPFRMAPLIFITTVITHLFCGSAGREGAALQIGGSLGASIGKLIKMDDSDKHIMTLCGMSAVFAALFGTPVTAALFSVEVISIGILYYSALVPCILSATISYAITEKFHITPTYFILNQVPEMSLATGIRVIILSVAAAVLSILFCMSMQVIGKTFKKYLKNQYLRILVGGVLLVLLTLAVRCNDYNGAGMNIIEQAIHGTAKPEAFILKLLFTCITIGCGFRGGEIVPSFCIGATFGCVLGHILGLSPSICAASGMVALFCGVTNCPLTSILIAFELFGFEGVSYYLIAVSISYAASGYYGLYKDQTIVYSKYKAKYVNHHTKM